MADVLFDVAGGVKKRLQDMGDGSHAEVVVASDPGGSGSSEVEVTNFPATQAVTGPMTDAQDSAKTGTAASGSYSDETGAAEGTVIGLLKGIYVQNAEIIGLLTAIETNTDTGGV